MATSIEKLLQLKEEVAQAKIDSATVSGALQQNLQRLKDEFQCRSLEMAKVKLNKLKEQKEELTQQIEDAVAKLEENYQW